MSEYELSAGISVMDRWKEYIRKVKIVPVETAENSILIVSPKDFELMKQYGMVKTTPIIEGINGRININE